MGEKYVFVRVGKAFLCTEKGYYIPLIYWAEVPNASAVGGKTGVVRGFRSIGKNCACAGGKKCCPR